MKYKINNKIIDAESPIKALKISKALDSIKDFVPEETVKYYQEKVNQAIKMFGRIGGALYDELDEHGLYVDDGFTKFIVKRKVNDSIKDSTFNFTIHYKNGRKENITVSANNYHEAIKKIMSDPNVDSVDDINDSMKDEESIDEKIHKAQEWVDFDIKHHGKVSELTKEDIKKMGLHFDEWNNQVSDSKCKDDDIDYLSEEEEQAIEDYKKAIMNTNDVKLLKLFAHILKEETEHLEELQNEEVEDSVKDDKLSPMTYKKLRELGYNEDRWKNLTQEEANRIVAKHENKSSEKKEKISREELEMKKDIESELKEYASHVHFKINNIKWNGKKALIQTNNDDEAYKKLNRDYYYNTVEKKPNGIEIEFD